MFEVFADDDESYYWAKVALCVVMLVTTCFLLFGCSEPSAEEVTAQAEREAYDKKITFTMPLAWTFSSTQCNTKDGCKTRYYQPSRSK